MPFFYSFVKTRRTGALTLLARTFVASKFDCLPLKQYFKEI